MFFLTAKVTYNFMLIGSLYLNEWQNNLKYIKHSRFTINMCIMQIQSIMQSIF